MNLLESLGREAILIALFSGETRLDSETVESHERDPSGLPVFIQRFKTVPADSLIVEIARKWLYDNKKVRDELMRYVVDALKAKPELFGPMLGNAVAEMLVRTKSDDWGGRQTYVQSELMQSITRTAAAHLLEADEAFRGRVLDMAQLSDSDRIEVKIELKPGGGNAR